MLPGFLKAWLSGRSLPVGAESWPEPLRNYMQKKQRIPKSTPLAELRFVVFDTETTGLDLATNRLLSIAGVGLLGHEVQLGDAFEAMVAQPDVGGAEAAVVHGLISNDLADGLPENEAAARFLDYAAGAVLVAHHAAFDMRMLQKAIAPHRGAKVWNPSIDTAQLARRVDVGSMSSNHAHGVEQRGAYQLDNLVRQHDIEVRERHTAAGDALATALLLQRLLRKAERRGIRTFGDLISR